VNITILLKILSALACVTDQADGVNTVASQAIALKQSLELLMSQEPSNVQQLNNLIAGCVCNDWDTFEKVGCFVAACLTQGQAGNVPVATQHFQNMCGKVVQ
jgi:trehalose-6-phosphate synthase